MAEVVTTEAVIKRRPRNPHFLPGGFVTDDHVGESRIMLPWPYMGAILGGTGSGKTEYALGVALWQAHVRGEGFLFVEPSGQAAAKAKRFLTAPGIRERVVEISRVPDDKGRRRPVPSYNPLDMTGADSHEVADRVVAFANTISALNGWNSKTNTRAYNLTLQSVGVLLELALRLPPELQPTIFQIPTLLTNDDWRTLALEYVPPSLRAYWQHEFRQVQKDAVAPVTHMVHMVRTDPTLRAMLGGSRSTFSLKRAIDERQIVMVSSGALSSEQKFISNLLLYDLVRALFSRGEVTPDSPWFGWYLDELQTYDGAVGGSVADLLEQVRKFFGRPGFVMMQNLLRLQADTQRSVLTNTQLKMSAVIDYDSAQRWGKGWMRGPHPSVLPGLRDHHFVVETAFEGRRRDPFEMRSVPVDRLFARDRNDDGVPELEARLASNGRSAREVTAELESLDMRILNWMQREGGEGHPVKRETPPKDMSGGGIARPVVVKG